MNTLDRVIRHYVRPVLRRVYHNDWARAAVYFPADLYSSLRGRDPLIPPKRLAAIGLGDYRAVGNEFLDHFIRLGGLQPNHSVLDVGCGTGRMALALAGYLNQEGRYEGFDVVERAISWCQTNFTPRHPNFRFQHFNLFNKAYNPRGTLKPADLRFPYGDQRFDLVFLTSVFTHMLPADVHVYLHEIQRVLRPGGRALCTFFILNEESRGHLKRREGQLTFDHERGSYSLHDAKVPEINVAFDESAVRQMHVDNGLTLLEPIHYGSWSGRVQFTSYQDIVVSRR